MQHHNNISINIDHFVIVFGDHVWWQCVQNVFWKRLGFTCTPFHLYLLSWYSQQCLHLIASSLISHWQNLHCFMVCLFTANKIWKMLGVFVCPCKFLVIFMIKLVPSFCSKHPCNMVFYYFQIIWKDNL